MQFTDHRSTSGSCDVAVLDHNQPAFSHYIAYSCSDNLDSPDNNHDSIRSQPFGIDNDKPGDKYYRSSASRGPSLRSAWEAV